MMHLIGYVSLKDLTLEVAAVVRVARPWTDQAGHGSGTVDAAEQLTGTAFPL